MLEEWREHLETYNPREWENPGAPAMDVAFFLAVAAIFAVLAWNWYHNFRSSRQEWHAHHSLMRRHRNGRWEYREMSDQERREHLDEWAW